MKKYIISLGLAVICVSLLYVEEASAGAWMVPKYKVWGEYYMKWDYAKDEFNAERKRKGLGGDQDARSWEFVQEPKIEYGINDWSNLLFSMEYKEAHYKEYDRPASWGAYSHKHHGITNVKVGGKVNLMKEPFVLSAQGKVFIYPGYGIDHGDDPSYSNQPSIGYGDDAFELRALIGKTFDIPFTEEFKLPCYVGAETGYRWRTNHVCNDIPYFLEGGFWPIKTILIKSEIDGYHVHAGTGSIKTDYGVWRIGGVYQVFGDSVLREGDKMFNIEFQYGMTLWGKNTAAYEEWILKVQTQF